MSVVDRREWTGDQLDDQAEVPSSGWREVYEWCHVDQPDQ
jgi:hypothetical protein